MDLKSHNLFDMQDYIVADFRLYSQDTTDSGIFLFVRYVCEEKEEERGGRERER